MEAEGGQGLALAMSSFGSGLRTTILSRVQIVVAVREKEPIFEISVHRVDCLEILCCALSLLFEVCTLFTSVLYCSKNVESCRPLRCGIPQEP